MSQVLKESCVTHGPCTWFETTTRRVKGIFGLKICAYYNSNDTSGLCPKYGIMKEIMELASCGLDLLKRYVKYGQDFQKVLTQVCTSQVSKETI